jgi:hypothetical protein
MKSDRRYPAHDEKRFYVPVLVIMLEFSGQHMKNQLVDMLDMEFKGSSGAVGTPIALVLDFHH